MLMVMIGMMMALMMELMLKRYVPLQSEVFANKMSSQRDLGVLDAGESSKYQWSVAAVRSDIAEVHKKLDDFREYVNQICNSSSLSLCLSVIISTAKRCS